MSEKTNPSSQCKRGLNRAGTAIAVVLFLAVPLALYGRPLFLACATNWWSKTTGKIVKTRIDSYEIANQNGPPTTRYTPVVSYEYKVNDSSFRSERLAYNPLRNLSRQQANAIASYYARKPTVDVYFSSRDPSQAVLVRGITGHEESYLALAFLGGALTVFSLGMAVGVGVRREIYLCKLIARFSFFWVVPTILALSAAILVTKPGLGEWSEIERQIIAAEEETRSIRPKTPPPKRIAGTSWESTTRTWIFHNDGTGRLAGLRDLERFQFTFSGDVMKIKFENGQAIVVKPQIGRDLLSFKAIDTELDRRFFGWFRKAKHAPTLSAYVAESAWERGSTRLVFREEGVGECHHPLWKFRFTVKADTLEFSGPRGAKARAKAVILAGGVLQIQPIEEATASDRLRHRLAFGRYRRVKD